MPRNSAGCVVPDPNGVLWLCTSEGLVRFDGSEFRVFDEQHGLPSRRVVDFSISKSGGYWLLTDAGVCFLPPGSKVGDNCRTLSPVINPGDLISQSLVEAPYDGIWLVTNRALYLSSADHRQLNPIPLSFSNTEEQILRASRGPLGGILLSTNLGVYWWDGKAEYKMGPLPENCGLFSFSYGGPRDIWFASGCGLYRLTGDAHLPRSLAMTKVPFELPPSSPPAREVFRTRDGSIWIASGRDLIRTEERPDGKLIRAESFGLRNGVPHAWVHMLAEDAKGNLWGSTEGLGVFRIGGSGFQVYYEDDGIGSARVSSIFEDLRGEICVTASPSDRSEALLYWQAKSSGPFQPIQLRRAPGFAGWGWGWNQLGLQGRNGDWWFPSSNGIYRYLGAPRPRALTRTAALLVYDRGPDFPVGEIFRTFEDSRGDIWFSTVAPQNLLVRWDHASGQFRRWLVQDGWPKDAIATVIRESLDGSYWFGTFDEVLRLRNHHFEKVSIIQKRETPKEDSLFVRDIHVDRQGRVWIASGRLGLFRCDNPDAAVPTFRHYDTRAGLSSNSIRSITEDNSGFIYVGTVRGVDRIDPLSPIDRGNILHYTSDDGLPVGEQSVAYCDHRGHLWFGTLHGLAEFDPSRAATRPVPNVYIRRLRGGGDEISLPWRGTNAVDVDLSSSKNRLEIDYAGIDLSSVASVRYQYKLEGIDSNWSPPEMRSSLNFADLPAGTRTFTVRAVGPSGEVGEQSAVVRLSVEAALWKRGWFVATAFLLLTGCAYWIYNYRVGNLIALERLRTRIATDLHDDIGSSLTQISLLSELGRRDASRDVLTDVAKISRDLLQDMSDIVWAISPRHDRFDSLVQRMRAFAEDSLPDGELVFDASDLPANLSLSPESRRPLYLVFKEAVNNMARHSGATQVKIHLFANGGVLSLVVEDNGCGFDSERSSAGEGLASIRRRLRERGGTSSWESELGAGTKFCATLPLGSHVPS